MAPKFLVVPLVICLGGDDAVVEVVAGGNVEDFAKVLVEFGRRVDGAADVSALSEWAAAAAANFRPFRVTTEIDFVVVVVGAAVVDERLCFSNSVLVSTLF